MHRPMSVLVACAAVTAATLPAAAASTPDVNSVASKRLNAVPGLYRGHFIWDGKKAEKIKFRVTKNGKYFTKFRALLQVTCGLDVYINELSYPKTKIKRNHRFDRTWRPIKKHPEYTIRMRGRFKGKRLVSGSVRYRVGGCYRDSKMKARRVSR